MKQIVVSIMVFVLTVVGFSSLALGKDKAGQTGPIVEATTPVKMSKKAKVEIKGKGFQPGQEVNILFTAKDGIQSDIGYALKPAPKADDSGAWATSWSCGRFIKKKMVKDGGVYKVTVTDSEYNPLTHTSISFNK